MSTTNKNILNIPVLGLNANWQAADVYPASKALGMLYSGTGTALNLDGGNMVPTKWEEWETLPVSEEDDAIKTLHGEIRIPRIIIAVNYKQIKSRRIALTNKNLARYYGFRCGYTNEYVSLEDGSLDHLNPKANKGKKTWDNSVWTSKKRNSLKSDKTIEELGWTLKKRPPTKAPELIPSQKIRFDHGVKFPEWEYFLK